MMEPENSRLVRCSTCKVIFEMPEMYAHTGKLPEDAGVEPGFCFNHNVNRKEREKMFNARKKFIARKYKLSFLTDLESTSINPGKVESFWNHARKNNPYVNAFDLEMAIAKFSYDKRKGVVPIGLVGPLTKINNDSERMFQRWEEIKEEHAPYFWTKVHDRDKGVDRIVILTENTDIYTVTDNIVKSIKEGHEQHEFEIGCIGYCSELDCNSKRGNIEDELSEYFNKCFREYALMPKEEKKKVGRVLAA
ncbi:hypothetical protein KY308_03860 [Candidatus Woesearchaeota archaeon]|nr:hypothetical protein [Candidatus Woesearchaeota archaeon]